MMIQAGSKALIRIDFLYGNYGLPIYYQIEVSQKQICCSNFTLRQIGEKAREKKQGAWRFYGVGEGA